LALDSAQTDPSRKKRFCYTNKIIFQNRDNKKKIVTTTKCLVLSAKRLVAAAKFLVAATKILFVVPNFVAATKPFFSVVLVGDLRFYSTFYKMVFCY